MGEPAEDGAYGEHASKSPAKHACFIRSSNGRSGKGCSLSAGDSSKAAAAIKRMTETDVASG
jgi:hypothetical protein